MALQGLQNYTFPLTLLGEVTINGNLNAKDVYVSGTLTGTGISGNILAADNTWTGTNDFQNVTTYTGTSLNTSELNMLTKGDIDDIVTNYSPLGLSGEAANWAVAPVFSNANPPTVPVQTLAPFPGNILPGYTDMVNIITPLLTDITKNETNTFTGINTFSGTIQADTTVVPSLLEPTLAQQAASKGYIDGKVELAGKSVIYQLTTPGTYSFTGANLVNGTLANIGKIDYWLFSGSCGGASGAVVSGTIGNGNGTRGSIVLTIGTVADPAVVETSQDTNVPSSTYILVSNQRVGSALGACNLNGVLTPGVIGTTTMPSNQGLSADGQLAANNALDYSNLLGTTTSAGGCLFVLYYI